MALNNEADALYIIQNNVSVFEVDSNDTSLKNHQSSLTNKNVLHTNTPRHVNVDIDKVTSIPVKNAKFVFFYFL